jgi:hypothetical protein
LAAAVEAAMETTSITVLAEVAVEVLLYLAG